MVRFETWRVACLLLVGLIAGTVIGYAQARGVLKPTNVVVLSGPDIGFRVEGVKENSVSGKFVVRVSGKWVDIDNSFAFKPATNK